jgi:hypothetical protein
MVFALLIGAIIWNLGTWYLGLPASSSHTLIGSIIGAGRANQLMPASGGASGVDWAQASKVGYSLLLSPLIGFVAGTWRPKTRHTSRPLVIYPAGPTLLSIARRLDKRLTGSVFGGRG